ncbi:unnamed protein product, partial [Musa acuminata subsp. malaccensis]
MYLHHRQGPAEARGSPQRRRSIMRRNPTQAPIDPQCLAVGVATSSGLPVKSGPANELQNQA